MEINWPGRQLLNADPNTYSIIIMMYLILKTIQTLNNRYSVWNSLPLLNMHGQSHRDASIHLCTTRPSSTSTHNDYDP